MGAGEQSQASYKETPYQDQAWEVVGELLNEKDFVPLDVAIVPQAALMVDPMFADYGGIGKDNQGVRKHLPEHLARGHLASEDDEANEIKKIKLTPQELEEIKAQAFAAGTKEGMDRAVEANVAKLTQMQGSVQSVINDIAAQVTENLRNLERESADLVIKISEKLLEYAVEVNPEYITKIVKEALSHAGSAVIKKVQVSPQDMEFIDIVGLPKEITEAQIGWSFEKDETVRSGCIVETSAGEIDFRLDAAWERMKNNILKVTR